jgi:hypothetical protein
MKNVRCLSATVLLVMLLPIFTLAKLPQQTASRRVIILGIDGLSTDGLQIANVPNINKLIHSGAISLKARAVMPTVSAPNWTSMLTGAGPEQHGVTRNGWTQQNATIKPTVQDADGLFPSIFTVLREQKPNAIIAGFYDWDELANFYNWKSVDTAAYIKAHTLEDYIAGDKETYRQAIPFIIEKKPDLTFVYAGSVDETGHELGHGTEAYYNSITLVDSLIGNLIDALKENKMYDDTYFIIITDHGGVGFGHGGESMDEIEVPWIISGPGIINDRMIEQPVNTLDTAPTVAYILGLHQPDAWTGKSVLGAFASEPASKINTKEYLAKPFVSIKSGFYAEPQTVSMNLYTFQTEIRYTTNGSAPTELSDEYQQPIHLDRSTVLRAVAVHGATISRESRVSFIKIQKVSDVFLKNPPNVKYKGDGAKSLVDGKQGTLDYKDAAWLGFEGDNAVATLDLGKPVEISKITVGYLSNIPSWIFPPKDVTFKVSNDGKTFREVDVNSEARDLNKSGGVRKVTSKIFSGLKVRFVKVIAQNQGICPPDHPGAGKKAWLFIDEIYIE